MAQVKKYGCEKQRIRYGEGNNEGVATITGKQNEDDRYEGHSITQILQHRVQCVMKLIAAVEHADQLHTLDHDVIVELAYLLLNPLDRRIFFGALTHEHTTLANVGHIRNSALWATIGCAHVPGPNPWPPVYNRDVLYTNWSPIRSPLRAE